MAAHRLDQLIQDALDYSKVVRRDWPLQPVDLSELLRGMLDSYPNLQASGADIRVEFGELVVQGNESVLTQCFSNLLGNAVKFAAPGTVSRVRVRTEERESTVRIWVEDNGIGIPQEAQERIFGMFQRLHRAEEYPGTGIGLALVRKAVQRLGGQVGLESEVGKGSRFWIEPAKGSPA